MTINLYLVRSSSSRIPPTIINNKTHILLSLVILFDRFRGHLPKAGHPVGGGCYREFRELQGFRVQVQGHPCRPRDELGVKPSSASWCFEASAGYLVRARVQGKMTFEVLDSVTAQGKGHKSLIASCYIRIGSKTLRGKQERNERKNNIQCCVARGLGITA